MVSLHHNWTNICCSVWPCSYRLGFASYSFMNRIYKNWKVLKLYWIFYYPFFGSFVVCPIIILSLIYFPSFVCMCMMCLCLMYIECWDRSIIINRLPSIDHHCLKCFRVIMMQQSWSWRWWWWRIPLTPATPAYTPATTSTIWWYHSLIGTISIWISCRQPMITRTFYVVYWLWGSTFIMLPTFLVQ